MKALFSSRGLFLLGFFVLIAVNSIVLLGVSYNRSGNPETVIELTERELRMPYRVHKENSGMALDLKWRVLGEEEKDQHYYYGYYSRSPMWFDASKLKELGFRTEDYTGIGRSSRDYKEPVSRQVFIVLENNGKPYQEAVARAERSLERLTKRLGTNQENNKLEEDIKSVKTWLERERIEESRLFAIDAGLDAEKLRKKYDDRSRYIVTPGVVSLGYGYGSDAKRKRLYGRISRLSVENVNVPLKLRDIFDSILVRDQYKRVGVNSPRYKVKLAFGHRYEPWIQSIHLINK